MSKTLRVGAARVDITPRSPIPMAGVPGRTALSEGVLDSLWARAVVFADIAGRPVVLISLDLFELSRSETDGLRVLAADLVGTSADRICVACTHTHSAPATYPKKDCGEFDRAYMAELHENVKKAVRLAWGKRKPARLTVGTAPLTVGANRRASLRADRGGPSGDQPADTRIRALVASDMAESPIAVILEYPCHPTCLPPANRLLSGDFPGRTSAALESLYGTDVVVMYLNGCAGDIAPREGLSGSIETLKACSDAVTRAAHDAVVNAHSQPQPSSDRPLDAARAVVPLPFLKTAVAPGAPANLPVAVHHLSLGPVDLVAISGDVFHEVAQELRRRTGREDLWVASFCNGGQGYIPTDAALAEGGYEPADSNAYYNRPPLQPGAFEKLVSETFRLLTTPRQAPKIEGRRGL